MERLFSPCNRLHDTIETSDHFWDDDEHDVLEQLWVRELELDVSSEELLSAEMAFTYADFYAMLNSGITFAWLAPIAAVMRADGRTLLSSFFLLRDYTFSFLVDGEEIHAAAGSPDYLLEMESS